MVRQVFKLDDLVDYNSTPATVVRVLGGGDYAIQVGKRRVSVNGSGLRLISRPEPEPEPAPEETEAPAEPSTDTDPADGAGEGQGDPANPDEPVSGDQ